MNFSIFASAQQIFSTAQPRSSALAQSSASAPPQQKDFLLQPMPDGGFIGFGFESSNSKLQAWINGDQALQVRLIGVYRKVGVGKTSLLKKVYNLYMVSNVFTGVIWVTVSQDYQIFNLQCQIAEAINLDLSSITNVNT